MVFRLSADSCSAALLMGTTSNAPVHSDHFSLRNDLSRAAATGRRFARLFSPADAHRMYVEGELVKVCMSPIASRGASPYLLEPSARARVCII